MIVALVIFLLGVWAGQTQFARTNYEKLKTWINDKVNSK